MNNDTSDTLKETDGVERGRLQRQRSSLSAVFAPSVHGNKTSFHCVLLKVRGFDLSVAQTGQ